MGMDIMQSMLLEQEMRKKKALEDAAKAAASTGGFDPPPPTPDYNDDPGFLDDPDNAQPQDWQNSPDETGNEVDDVDTPRDDENLFTQVHAQDTLRDPASRRNQEYEEDPINPLSNEERDVPLRNFLDPETNITSEVEEGTQPGLNLQEDPPPPQMAVEGTQPTKSRQEAFFDEQDEWRGRRPDRNNPEYKASTGRKILAALAGGLVGLTDPKSGMNMIGDVINAKYNAAHGDWTEEGKHLGDVGELLQKGAETKRKYRANDLTFEASMAGIKQRREAEDLRHADRFREDLTDRERLEETNRHNQELEGIAGEENRISQQNANTRGKTADAYVSRTNELNKRGPKRPGVSAQTDAYLNTADELFLENPDMERYFHRDPKSKLVMGLKASIGDDLSPEELLKLQNFIAKAKKKAELSYGFADVDDDPTPPFSDFELPPPNRKRAVQ